jgi:hypothetical protein
VAVAVDVFVGVAVAVDVFVGVGVRVGVAVGVGVAVAAGCTPKLITFGCPATFSNHTRVGLVGR